MHGLEGVLATGGFWLCMILLIFRSAIRQRILSVPTKDTVALDEMKAHIKALELRLNLMTTELEELREVQNFDRRLAAKPLATGRTITTSVAGAGKLTLPQK